MVDPKVTLKPGRPEPAFAPKKTRPSSTVMSQSTLNELVEDWNAMYEALRPFAQFVEGLPPVIEGQPRLTDSGPAVTCSPFGVNYVISFADLRKAKAVLESAYAKLEARRVAEAERALGGLGHVCRLCGTPIDGADDHELQGYCSKTCKREDNKSEWPAPQHPASLVQDPMFTLGPAIRKKP